MDLSKVVPHESETVQRIYEWHKRMGDAEPARGYLGASIIGLECGRRLWFQFRNCIQEQFDGRMYRLFETGDLEESRFVRELRAIGVTVEDTDDQGNQWSVSSLGGHFSGHMDGVALGVPEAPKTWHVLEFKTHNAKSFADLEKKGVQVAKPQHYAQMMVYMGLTGMTRALYLAKNKDTDELYGERVRYDAGEFARLIAKARAIVQSVQPLDRCASRPDDFRCKFCPAFALCWGTGFTAVPLPSISCRTCCHSTPEIDEGKTWARWSCAKHKRNMDAAGQAKACEYHLLIPGLVTFADPVDSGDDWIEFKNQKDGAVWRHGLGSEAWSTEELINSPGPLAGPKAPAAGFDVPELTLIDRYPANDSRLIFESDDVKAEHAKGFFNWCEGQYGSVTAVFEDDTREAVEYAGKYLAVYYRADNFAVVWEGVE